MKFDGESTTSSLNVASVTTSSAPKRPISDISEENDKQEPVGDANKVAEVVTPDEVKKRIKEKQQKKIDVHKKEIADNVLFHEQGWKERYYGDKFKKKNIQEGGGLQKMCFTYIEGLCWVFKYYYVGCPSWNWYYPLCFGSD